MSFQKSIKNSKKNRASPMFNDILGELQIHIDKAKKCAMESCPATDLEQAKTTMMQHLSSKIHKHPEVNEIAALAMEKRQTQNNVKQLISKLADLLQKKEFKDDVAEFISAMNSYLAKPAADEKRMKDRLHCLNEHQCNVQDVKEVVELSKAFIDIMTYPKVLNAYVALMKNYSKAYDMFLKHVDDPL